jgi:ubiquinone/menaquinone biosynthesis C-methylase UbiE
MNCDRVARLYRWLEYLRFGRALERCRLAMLPRLGSSRKALLLGDGDGRFLTALAQHNSSIRIDAIDASREMIAVSRRRLARARIQECNRIHLQHGDVRAISPLNGKYDLIASHFFFDVFDTTELQIIIDRVAEHAADNALWVVSEFDLPARGWERLASRAWLKIMYLLFRLTTGLENQQLPEWRTVLQNAGFVRNEQQIISNGFIVSELWQRNESRTSTSLHSGT